MKYLVPVFWTFGGIFAVPFVVMALSFIYSPVPLEVFAANVAFLALPQLVWAFICGLWLPRSAYIGGFIAGNSFLIFTVLLYLIVITKNDPYHEGSAFAIGLFYLPLSPIAIPVGALVGYLIGRFFRATSG